MQKLNHKGRVIISLLFALAVCASINTGCSSRTEIPNKPESADTQKDNSFAYGDGKLTLDKIEYYEDEPQDYEYRLLVVAKLDCIGLSDKDMHYLQKDMKFTFSAESPEGKEFHTLSPIKSSIYKNESLVLSFIVPSYDQECNRETFKGYEATMTLENSETHDMGLMESSVDKLIPTYEEYSKMFEGYGLTSYDVHVH